MSSEILQHEIGHHNPTVGGYLREIVFGFNDGVISTFAIIAGLYGGTASQSTILLAALATMVAGAFSMGLGTYLGNKSARDLYLSEIQRELKEMEEVPEIERQEIRDIYSTKGFKGELLEKVVDTITSDKKVWLDTMMRDELGFGDEPEHPSKLAASMAIAFIVGSAMATSPYFLEGTPLSIFYWSAGASIMSLTLIGWLKTYFTQLNPLLSIAETLGVGIMAAGGAYAVGILIG